MVPTHTERQRIRSDANRLLPLPIANDRCYAVLQGSRSIFEISDDLHRFLSGTARRSKSLLKECCPDISRLQATGFWNPFPRRAELSQLKFGISLHLVHGCNLACGYCNVQKGTYGEAETSKMDLKTALAALDWLEKERRNRFPQLVLYGGEPLLNWAVFRQSVNVFRRRHPDGEITVVTNGTLITGKRAQFLADNRVRTIISIDGPEEVHDKNRPMRAAGSSHRLAVNGLKRLQKAGADYHIRATWQQGSGSYDTVLEYLNGLAGDPLRVTIGVEFSASAAAAGEEYNEIMSAAYAKANGKVADIPVDGRYYLNLLLRADELPLPVCEAGLAGFSVTPDGDLYPCQVAVSNRQRRLGSIHHGFDADGRENLASFLGNSPPGCNNCWAVDFCGGPCRFETDATRMQNHCRKVKLHLTELLAVISRADSYQLADVLWPANGREACTHSLNRQLALRELLRDSNVHVKPVALLPSYRKTDMAKAV